jgi:hypothetical protein
VGNGDGEGIAFGQVVRLCAALATAGAGVLHLDAAGDHTEHWHIAGFFVTVAVVQLLWAAAVARRTFDRRVFVAGLAFDLAVLVVWVVSRAVGLPDWIPDAGGVEALGWKDATASGLALVAIAAGGMVLTMPATAAGALLAPRTGERILRAMAVAALVVTVPATLASHEHGDHEHGEVDGDLASAVEVHEHSDDPEHAHTDDATADPAEGETHVHAEVLEGDPHTPSAGHAHTTTAAAPAPAPDHAHASTATAGPAADAHEHTAAAPAGHAHDATVTAASTLPAMHPLEGPGNVTTVRLGPFALLPDIPSMPPPHLGAGIPRIAPGELNLVPLIGVPPPCQDCYVLGLQPDLVYLDGSPANLDTGPMLHHAVWTDMSRRDPVCSSNTLVGQLGHRVFAAGNERTGFAAPEGFGMPVGRGVWGGAVELMNMSQELKLVYVQLTSRWVPLSTPNIEPVTSVWLDIDSCGDSEVNIPAGVTDIPWDWRSKLTGRVIGAGGHLHDGGQWLSLVNQTTGEHVCTSVAGYGTKPQYLGSVESMSTCAWDRLGSVRKGDVLRLNAHYNTARPEVGVMGIMVILLHETGDLDAGQPSPYPAEPPADTGVHRAEHAH